MKIYIAQKPCRFGGKEYHIGDEVPEKLIDPARVKSLIKFGLLSVSERAEEATDTPANNQNADIAQKSANDDKDPENTQEADQQQSQPVDEEKAAEETIEKPKATGKKGAKK